jgi:hypothetical protein
MATLLGLFNATLSAVTAAGFAPDYDRAAAPGASKFSGAERVMITESQERTALGGGSDWILHRELLVDPEINVSWAVGDIVTFTLDQSGTPETATVRRYGTSGSSVTGYVTRLIFEDA